METLQPKLRFPEFDGNWESKIFKKTCVINPSNKKLPQKFIYIDLESVNNGLLHKENEILLDEAPSRAQRLLNKKDVLFQMVRPYQKNNFYFDKEGDYVASTGYAQLRANESSKFLFQYLHNQKFVDKVIEKCTGSNYPSINSTDLANIIVVFPENKEQTKIANFLSSIDEKLNLLKEKKALLEDYKKGIMQKIFNQEIRFKDDNGNDFEDWENKTLGECLNFEQPTKYLVDSTDYNGDFETPVLTAGKTFILGYTDEVNGIFKKEELPVIIFDDFTTATQFVDFQFKAKSSAMKILKAKENTNIKFVYEAMQNLKFEVGGHGRHWISIYSNLYIDFPSLSEQTKIANFLTAIDEKIELVSNQIQDTQEYKKGLLQKMFV
jgi:type I restriction enzyme S subunit